MPAFPKLRSMTPRGSRRKKASGADDPLPETKTIDSPEGSVSSVNSSWLSSNASVNLYTQPEASAQNRDPLQERLASSPINNSPASHV